MGEGRVGGGMEKGKEGGGRGGREREKGERERERERWWERELLLLIIYEVHSLSD